MKKRSSSSIDGFIPRRASSEIGQPVSTQKASPKTSPKASPKATRRVAVDDRALHTGDNEATERIGEQRSGKEIGKSDISESLRRIDDDQELAGGSSRSRRQRRKDKRAGKLSKKPKSKLRRIIKWTLITLAAAALAVLVYVGYKVFIAGNNVFNGNFFDLVQSAPLKEDKNGRSNFLVFGVTEQDKLTGHEGGNLTDSLMVLSVDQDKKDAYVVSLPRDLWVEYDDPCFVGYQGKINAVYKCGSNDGEDPEAGAKKLMKKASEVTGLDMHYYVHLNFAALVETVDAIGGIELTIQTDDPRGILDRNFDWKCNYQCYYVKYAQGERVKLDGEHALALSRARNAAEGYGLPGGNFDRERNQQLIGRAILDKALSVGTLTNLGAVTGLIDALGNNIDTNIEKKEIRTLMDLATKIPNDKIISLDLLNEDDPLVTTGPYSGQSIVRPIAGLLDYSQIRAYITKEVSNDPFVKEEPQVTVLNGSSQAGVAQTAADRLADKGFTINVVGNAPDGSYQAVEVYQLNTDKPESAKKLAELYGVTVKTTAPPVSVVGSTDFLVIIGDAAAVQ